MAWGKWRSWWPLVKRGQAVTSSPRGWERRDSSGHRGGLRREARPTDKLGIFSAAQEIGARKTLLLSSPWNDCTRGTEALVRPGRYL